MQQKIFYTIREIAETGLMSEYALRRMVRNGDIPCIYSGNRCLINYNMLLELINSRDSRIYASDRGER